MNPEVFKQLKEEMSKPSESLMKTYTKNLTMEQIGIEEQIQFESLNQINLEEQPINILENDIVKDKIDILLEKYIIPLDIADRNHSNIS